MNKLKQNIFWVATGVAGAVVVVFFAVGVVPRNLKKGELQSSVRNQVRKLKQIQDIPGNPDIASFKEAKEKTIEQYQKIGDFYGKSNEHLERWFPDLRLAANQDPPRDGFMAIYRREREEIEKSLKDKGIAIGVPDPSDSSKANKYGFSWEDPQTGDWDPQRIGSDEKRVMKEIQKRFWARQRVAQAILTILGDNGKVSRVHDFRFFRKLHPSLATSPWETFPAGQDAVHYAGVGSQPNVAPPNFLEYDLPQKLGKTMTFGFALELPYSQVPRVISEILNPAAEKGAAARLLISVIGTHVTIREQNEPEVRKTVPKGDPTVKTAEEARIKASVKPIDVLVTVTCQIVDFEPSELKKLDAPAPASAPAP